MLLGQAPPGTLSATRRPGGQDRYGDDNLYLANFSCFGAGLDSVGPGVGRHTFTLIGAGGMLLGMAKYIVAVPLGENRDFDVELTSKMRTIEGLDLPERVSGRTIQVQATPDAAKQLQGRLGLLVEPIMKRYPSA